MGKKSRTRLDTLPLGVLLRVLWFLEPRDVAAVGATCRRLHRAANEPLVWRRLAEASAVAVPDESAADRTSPAWAAQAGSRSVLPYKYAVCLELGRPPQDVGLTAATANYGRLRVGSTVVIHKHRPVCCGPPRPLLLIHPFPLSLCPSHNSRWLTNR